MSSFSFFSCEWERFFTFSVASISVKFSRHDVSKIFEFTYSSEGYFFKTQLLLESYFCVDCSAIECDILPPNSGAGCIKKKKGLCKVCVAWVGLALGRRYIYQLSMLGTNSASGH